MFYVRARVSYVQFVNIICELEFDNVTMTTNYALIFQCARTIADKEDRKFDPVHVVEKDFTTLTYFYLSRAAVQAFVQFHLDFQVAKELKIGQHNSVTFVLPSGCP